MSTQSTTIQAEIPARLLLEVRSLVDSGWFQSVDEVVIDAVRRFVETHQADLIEKFAREDIEWGLRGAD